MRDAHALIQRSRAEWLLVRIPSWPRGRRPAPEPCRRTSLDLLPVFSAHPRQGGSTHSRAYRGSQSRLPRVSRPSLSPVVSPALALTVASFLLHRPRTAMPVGVEAELNFRCAQDRPGAVSGAEFTSVQRCRACYGANSSSVLPTSVLRGESDIAGRARFAEPEPPAIANSRQVGHSKRAAPMRKSSPSWEARSEVQVSEDDGDLSLRCAIHRARAQHAVAVVTNPRSSAYGPGDKGSSSNRFGTSNNGLPAQPLTS